MSRKTEWWLLFLLTMLVVQGYIIICLLVEGLSK